MNVTTRGKVDRATIRSIDPALADRPERRLQYGDILFNNTNSVELVGKTAFFSGNDSPAFSNHMTRLRTHTDRVIPEFLARYLHACWARGDFAQLANNHVSQASVGRKVLSELPLPLPPIAVQRRIADRLDEIEGRRQIISDRLHATGAMMSNFRRAVLTTACLGQLTDDWRTEKGAEDFGSWLAQLTNSKAKSKGRQGEAIAAGLTSDTQIDLLPKSWRLVRLGDIFDVLTGATPLRSNERYYEGGTVPWVTSGAVNAGVISGATVHITEVALRETNAKIFAPGTLLVAMYGEGQTRGRVAELGINAATNQAVAAIVFNEKNESLRAYLRLFFEESYQRVRTLSFGGVQRNLSLGVIRDTLIPMPPLAEQYEIVRRVGALLKGADAAWAHVGNVQTLLDRTAQEAITRAFHGEVG